MHQALPQLSDEIISRCKSLGFALAGICDASPSKHAADFNQWLTEGRHGSMSWLAKDPDTRTDPQKVLPGAQSIIMVADQYSTRDTPPPSAPAGHGRIARYAHGDDYHEVIKKRLHQLCDELRERFPDHQFRAFVDTAPIMEREYAARAGLGWIGKHTLLINPSLGSWLLLGGILTTLDIAPPESQRTVTDHCGTCTRCIDACPTDAITPYSVDATRCISYLTIERREAIDSKYFSAIAGLNGITSRARSASDGSAFPLSPPGGDVEFAHADETERVSSPFAKGGGVMRSMTEGVSNENSSSGWLFGCDICQDVCPHNSPRADHIDTGSISPAYSPRNTSFNLLELLNWTNEDRAANLKHSAINRAKLDMLKRSAAIILNSIQPYQDR